MLLFIPLALALGYDRMVGGHPLRGLAGGLCRAFLNPFNVGVAQGLSGLPLFSGMGYRLVVWAVATHADHRLPDALRPAGEGPPGAQPLL